MLDSLVDKFPLDLNSFVERKRSSSKVIALSILLYQEGLSLRRVEELLSYLDEDLTYRGVHYWIQKLGEQDIWKIKTKRNSRLPSKLVVDETKVKLGREHWYLYAAINPSDREILYASIYPARNHLTTKSFFKAINKKYGEKPEVAIVDGGPWYTIIERLGIKRKVVSGNIKNYIERWFQTLKRRIQNFYCYFPHSKRVEHANNWLKMFIFYHNRIRKHQGLGWKTPKEALN